MYDKTMARRGRSEWFGDVVCGISEWMNSPEPTFIGTSRSASRATWRRR